MFKRFFSKALVIIKIYLVTVLLFMVYRTICLFVYSNFNSFNNIVKAYSTGFKFDTIVSTYFLSLVLVLSLPFIVLKKKSWYDKFFNKVTSVYLQLCLFLILFLITVDFYYYRFFHNHFDSMFFGIFEDDTMAVLASVWKDYPVIWVTIFFVLSFLSIRWFVQKLFLKEKEIRFRNIILKTALFMVFLGLFAFGMRGSLGVFPVGKEDMIVCNDNSINDITPNAVFYLKETIADRSKYKISTDLAPVLGKYKFKKTEEAISILNRCDSAPSVNCLLTKTPENEFLKNNPPNVIFILMESFSMQFLSLHSEKFNLMGELENQIKHCIVFKNFTSCANGTILSFEGLVANTPTTPISQSQFNKIPLKSAAALPFKENNYTNLFITGSKLNWRNLGPWAGRQYFDKIEGRETLIEEVKGAQEGTWGVFDEFLFERIFQQLALNAKPGKPVFIFGFTVSNHTPYEVPESYKPFPLEMSDSLANAAKDSREYTWSCFRNYQYANHNLGLLIKKIRESEFGENTIIAVTGDHNCRNLFEYPDAQLLEHYGVPLILYVPEKYLSNSKVDIKRFGSHKDIFPTLYNVSLSSTEYLNTGNNLLSSDTSAYFYAVNGYNLGFDKNGAVNTNNNIRFQWNDKTNLLEPATDKSKLDKLYNMVRANSFCMDYFVRQNLEK
jgi:phosphoglycerol transferase MdoB-like AlkP superfamily enzyme